MHGTIEASKLWKGKSAYNPWTHISHKELIYLLQKFISPRSKVLLRMLLGERLAGVNHRVIPTSTDKEGNQRTPHASNFSHNVHHTCMLRDLPTLAQVFLNFIITQLVRLYHYHLYISKQLSSIKFIIVFNALHMKVFILPNLDTHHIRTIL